jgi:uncharacterized protein (TIGR02421 family)
VLARALRQGDVGARVRVRETDERHPPDMAPLLTARRCWELGALLLGLEVPPVFRDAETGAVYPVFLRRLRATLSHALRQCVFDFARVHSTAGLGSWQALGPRRFGNALHEVDRELADIESSFSLLLLVGPVNADEAWTQFRDGGFERTPDFRYRFLPVDPDLLRRRLWNLDMEDIADPAMASLLRDKRDELDLQLDLVAERNAAGFLLASMRLYGRVDDVLLSVARDVLAATNRAADGRQDGESLTADDFARLARAELDHYRLALPSLAADVQVRPDVTGLMVSQGNLLIGERSSIAAGRVDALLQHEVGTHVLTYYNGLAQPLGQLASGLAGYDELQEGLAVFSEYLAGGLTALRMRVLAARVLAAHAVEQGAGFVDTFRLLTAGHGFTAGAAFDIAERVHQSGGFTRDLIYLRGLLRLLEYLRAGGTLEPLYIGKLAAHQVEVVTELRAREFLGPAPLVPRVLERATTPARLDAVRAGLPLTGLIVEA